MKKNMCKYTNFTHNYYLSKVYPKGESKILILLFYHYYYVLLLFHCELCSIPIVVTSSNECCVSEKYNSHFYAEK